MMVVERRIDEARNKESSIEQDNKLLSGTILAYARNAK